MSFLAAIQFLTTLRGRRQRQFTPEQLAGSTGYFPLAGIIIGLILAGAYWLLQLILPSSIVRGLIILGAVILSGGLHLDGFIDTFDGIGGHKSTQARLKVMRDSHAGSFGIIGVVLLLLVKYLALSNVPDNLMLPALILMPTISRWTMVYAIFAHPYARQSGLGTLFKQGTSRRRFGIATALALGITIPLFHTAGLVIMLGAWLTALAAAYYLKGKFAGLTGDTYGAINEIAEVSVLILVCLLAHNGWLGLAMT